MAGCAVALAATVAMIAAPVAAAPRQATSAALGEISFDGLADESRRARFTEAVRSGLERSIRIVGPEAAAPVRIAASVRFAEPDYELSVEARDVAGKTIAQATQTCELCGLEEAVATAGSLAAALATKVGAIEHRPPIVDISASPSDVVIAIDGEVVGNAPLRRQVEVGPHEVHASKRGFVPQSRAVVAVAGVQETIVFDLQDLPRREPRSALGWASVGVGGGVLATGITFVALHGTDVRSLCSGSNVDADGDCRFVHRTQGFGIGFAAAGAVLVATGLALALGRGRRATQTRRLRGRLARRGAR